MANVLLQQVSSRFAKSNAGKTLDHPVALKHIRSSVDAECFTRLSIAFESGAAYFWGAKLERHHQLERMVPRATIVLFRRGTRVFRLAAIKELLVNVEVAQCLWGFDTDGQTWPIIYLMEKTREVSLDARELNKAMGRDASDNWQGMTSIDGEPAERVISYIKLQLEAGQ